MDGGPKLNISQAKAILSRILDTKRENDSPATKLVKSRSFEVEKRPSVMINKTTPFDSKYKLLEELGKGMFGTVRKCQCNDTGEMYAAKVVRKTTKSKEEVIREVTTMNQLQQHKSIAQIHDAFETSRQMIIVMELIRGKELFEKVVQDENLLTEKQCVYYLRQILAGVEYMHKKKIVHLDLKPENILCIDSPQGYDEIKLIDFGLARDLSSNTQLSCICGTPEFVAPEVINFDPISVQSDMWSLGVVTYVLMSGISPFLGDDDGETLQNVTLGEFDFDDEDGAFDSISEQAKEFISELLCLRPRDRLTVDECLSHPWLNAQTKEELIDTTKLKKFIARRRWLKTIHAIKAVGRFTQVANSLDGKKKGGSLASAMLAALKTSEEESKNVGGISQSQSSPAIMDLAKDPDGRKISQSHSSSLMNGESNGLDETHVVNGDASATSIFEDDEDTSDALKKRAERRRRRRFEEEEESFDVFANVPKSDENNNTVNVIEEIPPTKNEDLKQDEKDETVADEIQLENRKDEGSEEKEEVVPHGMDVELENENPTLIEESNTKYSVEITENVEESELDELQTLLEEPKVEVEKSEEKNDIVVDVKVSPKEENVSEKSLNEEAEKETVKPSVEVEEKIEISVEEKVESEQDESRFEIDSKIEEESKTKLIDSKVEQESKIEEETKVGSNTEKDSQIEQESKVESELEVEFDSNVETKSKFETAETEMNIEEKVEPPKKTTKPTKSNENETRSKSESKDPKPDQNQDQKQESQILQKPKCEPINKTENDMKIPQEHEDKSKSKSQVKSKSPPPPVTKKPSKVKSSPKHSKKDPAVSPSLEEGNDKVTSPKGSKKIGSKISGLLNRVSSPKSSPKIFKKPLSPRSSADKKLKVEQALDDTQEDGPSPVSSISSKKKLSSPPPTTEKIKSSEPIKPTSPKSLRKFPPSVKDKPSAPSTMKKPTSPRKEKPANKTTTTKELPSTADEARPSKDKRVKPEPAATPSKFQSTVAEECNSPNDKTTVSKSDSTSTSKSPPRSPSKDDSSKTRSSIRDRIGSHGHTAKTNMPISGKDKKGLFMKWENRIATPEQQRKSFASQASSSFTARNKSLLAAKRASFNKEASQERSTDSDCSNNDPKDTSSSPLQNRFQRNSNMRTSLNENNLSTARKRLVTKPHSIANVGSVKNRMAIFAKFEKQ